MTLYNPALMTLYNPGLIVKHAEPARVDVEAGTAAAGHHAQTMPAEPRISGSPQPPGTGANRNAGRGRLISPVFRGGKVWAGLFKSLRGVYRRSDFSGIGKNG